MFDKMNEKNWQKIIFELKSPKNAFYGRKIVKTNKNEKFSKFFFSKSIRNHIQRILKRKYGFRIYFPLQNFQRLSFFDKFVSGKP